MKKILSIIILCLLFFPLSVQAELKSFPKYQLSESQLKGLANICKREQGSAEGASAEASLMANLFELKGSSFGTGADGLVNYVRTSGWFGSTSRVDDTMYNGSADEEIINVVRNVLVYGKRTLPGYIDEHDCWDCNHQNYCDNGRPGDICQIITNGAYGNVTDRSAYVQFQTKVYNVYGSTYTFYSFPADNSDPFGYTSEANRQEIGDFCYEFDGSTSGGGPGSMDDPFTEFPSIKDDKFTCETIFLKKNQDGKEVETEFKKILDGIFLLIQIGAPVIATALSIMDYIKALASQDQSVVKKVNSKTIKRIGIAVALLFLPFLLDVVFHLFGLYDLSRCKIGG